MSAKDRTRNLFINELLTLSRQKPLEAVTVNDMLARTNAARQTFYNHFSDKHALITAVFQRFWTQAQASDTHDSRALLTQFCQNCGAEKVFCAGAAAMDNTQKIAAWFRQTAEEVLSRRIHDGFGAEMAEEMRPIVTFYAAGIAEMFRNWFSAGLIPAPDDFAHRIIQCIPKELSFIFRRELMDNGQFEKLRLLMATRFYMYQLMHVVFGDTATPDVLESIGSENTIRAFELLSTEDGDQMAQMSAFAAALPQKMRQPGYLDQVRSEYTTLFIGPDKLVAYPWESTYNGENNMLFQESTLRVRDFYKLYGYQPVRLYHAADDHIALMMDFMARMSQRVLDALESADYEKAAVLLRAQKVFMKEHLCNWVPQYAENLQKSKTALLYPPFGRALEAFLDVDQEFAEDALGLLETMQPGDGVPVAPKEA